MNPLKPFGYLFKFANTAGNVYLAGQISWWLYKKYREFSKTSLAAEEVRKRLILIYQEKFNREPTDDEIDAVINASGNETWFTKAKRVYKDVAK